MKTLIIQSFDEREKAAIASLTDEQKKTALKLHEFFS